MKQTLQLKLSQHLTLTPQLQQSIRLLQLSTLELSQELDQFLADNPFLDREDNNQQDQVIVPHTGTSSAEAQEQQDAPAAESQTDTTPAEFDWHNDSGAATNNSGSSRDDGDEPDFQQVAPDLPQLRDHLMGQLAMLNLERRDRVLVGVLIDALNDDGYLTQSLEDVLEALPEEIEIDPDELLIALRHLQHLDPAGIGARNAAECLELQLRDLAPVTEGRALAIDIVHNHLPLLASRDFVRLKRVLSCTDDQLRVAQRLVQSLNPRPGAAFSTIETRYVVPDVVVKKIKNVWLASLNPDAMPKLRINRMYADILQGNRSASSGQLSQRLQEARWMIKNVQQRFETILRVSQAIVDRQPHFFEHGEVAMRPLVLREIADVLGLHESTVSRVTTQKYMLTPRGIFELKYFFGSHVATDTGGACSATAIRALIRQMVAAEDDKRPLSDSKISQILGQQGIMVARRTIAKYRESLHIPPVSLRKAL